MKISSRREFLRFGGRVARLGAIGSLSRLGLMNAWAQGEDYKALVCIFLFGGNDSDNTVISVSEQYSNYQSGRGPLAIPRASLLPMFAGSQELGLHPAMSAMHPLYGQNRMALVANVGMLVRPLTRETYRNRTEPRPDNLFSHSNQQRQWQMAPPNSSPGTGWGGRIADRMQSVNSPSTFPMAVSVSGSSSLLVGETAQPASIGAGSSLGLDGSSDSAAG
ncbi:MAG: DUF1501 domain-containing protein, partial [bacterium]|nr:DUF1501 domain-containing protein [bacterium]